MGNAKYVKIHVQGGGCYIQPVAELATALDGELDGFGVGETLVISLTPVTITDDEYKKLPEFMGH